ncbi:unnamed protein product [Soboliphyme baturini]|uniref:Sm domain-containing protein n=1 Tax=Soboliphyme baturini TaxID=241478 RepID=A0A183IUY9_9BILA|nr:unnamed protein product [Soboliphyme baturini]
MEELAADDFDPRALLHAEDVKAMPNVMCFADVDSFEDHLRKKDPEIVAELLAEEARRVPTMIAPFEKLPLPAERRLALMGAPTPAKPPRRPAKTFLSAIAKHLYRGPLAALCSWVEQKERVEVRIRSRDGVHSVLAATVVAFDKFWNLALHDVDEVYYCPKRIRKFRTTSKLPLEIVPANLRYEPGLKVSSRIQQLTRHLPQLFVRGDNVISVALK